MTRRKAMRLLDSLLGEGWESPAKNVRKLGGFVVDFRATLLSPHVYSLHRPDRRSFEVYPVWEPLGLQRRLDALGLPVRGLA